MKNKLIKSIVLLTILFGFHGQIWAMDKKHRPDFEDVPTKKEQLEAEKKRKTAEFEKQKKEIANANAEAAKKKENAAEAEKAKKIGEVLNRFAKKINPTIQELHTKVDDKDVQKFITHAIKTIQNPSTHTDDKVKMLEDLAIIDKDKAEQIRGEETDKLEKIMKDKDSSETSRTAALAMLEKINPSQAEKLTKQTLGFQDKVRMAVLEFASKKSESLEEYIAAQKLSKEDQGKYLKAKDLIDKIQKGDLDEDALAKAKKDLLDIKKDSSTSLKALIFIHEKKQDVENKADDLIKKGVNLAVEHGVPEVKKFFTPENFKKAAKVILIAVGLGGGGGTLATLLGIDAEEDKNKDRDQDKIINDLQNNIAAGKSPNSPSAYEEADPNSKTAQETLPAIADFIGQNLVEAFLNAVQSEDYANKNFEIKLSPLTIDNTEYEFVVKYNFGEEGAGNPASPLICEVSITPDEIDGWAINIDTLINLINSENQDACTLILKPNAAFLFLLKAALLNKDVMNDASIKNDFDKIQKMRLHTMILCARLAKTKQYENTSIPDLLTTIPSLITTFIDDAKTRMHPEHVKLAKSAKQDSSDIQEAILGSRTALNYNETINATSETVLPLIVEVLSYRDKKLIVHAILRLISDLGDKLPKAATNQKTELAKRIKALIPVTTTAIESITTAGFDQKDIDLIKKASAGLNGIQSGAKTIAQNIPKPRIGEPKSGIQSVSLASALDIYLQQFQTLRDATLPKNLLLGKSETYDAIIAIYLCGIKMVSDAYDSLTQSQETSVKLRKLKSAPTINPSKEFEKCTKESLAKLNDALNAVAMAQKALRANPKKMANKKAYDDAKNELTEASELMSNSMQQFRSLYAPYLPMNGGKTALEFVRDSLKTVSTVGQKDAFTSMISSANFSLFKNALGLSAKDVYYQPIAAN